MAKGASKEDIARIWENLSAHSRYSFNNAARGSLWDGPHLPDRLAQGRWPLAYMTCLINSESGVGNKERGYNSKVAEYVEEARIIGLPVLPPCVKRSGARCSIDWQLRDPLWIGDGQEGWWKRSRLDHAELPAGELLQGVYPCLL